MRYHPVLRILFFLVMYLHEYNAMGQAPVAQQIFDTMVDTYATAKTYQDKAVVKNVFYESSGTETINTTERVGTVVFDRTTKRFRFEYREVKSSLFDLSNRYIIWSNGQQVKTWWTYYNEIVIRPSMAEALGAATGVSGGLTSYIPGLLFIDSTSVTTDWSIGQMTQLRYLGTGALHERACHRISGLNRLGKRLLLWVDQQSHVLIGIDEAKTILPNKVEVITTLRFDLIVNQAIPDQNFTFDVPPFYWNWFWPTMGQLLKFAIILLFIRSISRFVKWFRNRSITT